MPIHVFFFNNTLIGPVVDNEMVHLIDGNENEWPIRSFVADVLHWFHSDKFSAALVTYVDSFGMIS